jgi:hypothetical protein
MAGRMSSELAKLFRSRVAREIVKKEIKAAERERLGGCSGFTGALCCVYRKSLPLPVH